jgi:hypothetical protein
MDMTSWVEFLRAWMANNWTIVVPGMIVARYAFTKYNEPDTNRFSTTGLRFWVWRFVYLGLLLILTLFLALFLNTPGLRSVLFPGQMNSDLPATLLAALLVIGSFKYRAIQAIDSKMRATCHSFGYIPFGAVNLARSLTPAKFTIGQETRERLSRYIEAKAWLDDSLLAFFPDATTETGGRRFARNLVIMSGLENLSSETRYQPFFSKNSAHWVKINQDMEKYVAQTRSFFAAVRVYDGHAQTEAQMEEIKMLRDDYKKRCFQIYDTIVPFLSYAVHGSELTRGRVMARMKEMGFSLAKLDPPTIPMNAVVAAITLIGVILIGGGMAALPLDSPQQRFRFMFLNALALCSYLVAILAALLVKKWSPHILAERGERPMVDYVITGLLGFTLCYIVNIGFMAAGHQLLNVDFSFIPPLLNITVISALLSVIIAFACDDSAAKAVEPPALRLKEGLAAAVILPLAMFVVVRLLPFPDPAPGEAPVTMAQIIMFRMMLGGIGFVAAAFVPYQYRLMKRGNNPGIGLRADEADAPAYSGHAPA